MRQQWFTHVRLLIAHPPRYSETSTAALTTPALDRRSLRWFAISACTATPQDLPPSLAQHRSCRRSSTSSSLPFRTHVGAGNSAVVVDLPRWGPMLSPRVPNLVPIPGITGSARCAVRPLEGPRDHRVAPPTRCAAPANRPTRAHRRRPELARSDCGRARATEPSRVAGHPRHAVALAPAPHRRALDPTTATAGPTVDLSRASPTRTAPRSRESDLGIPPHPRRTRRARPPPRCVHGLADPKERPNRPRTHTLGSHLVAVPAVPGRRRLRLRHHRNRHAAQVLPAVLHRHRYPNRVLRRDHRPPQRRLGQPSRRNLFLHHADGLAGTRALVRDRGSQFTRAFDEIFRTEGCEVLKTPVRTPVANAFAERWIGTLRRELLDRTIIWNRRQLNKACRRLHRSLQHACQDSGRQHRRGWLDYNMPRLVVVASCCECLPAGAGPAMSLDRSLSPEGP